LSMPRSAYWLVLQPQIVICPLDRANAICGHPGLSVVPRTALGRFVACHGLP
jgi:hypothetical protein